jgi:hypothetical protein
VVLEIVCKTICIGFESRNRVFGVEVGMTPAKICYKCKSDLPIVCFKKHSKRKDGLQADCISCQKIYRQEHYLKNKSKYKAKGKVSNAKNRGENARKLKELKATLSCKCGENHPACLDFHHRDDSTKLYAVSQMMNFTWTKILEEIAKCDVVCSNCHRKLHYKE